jgi:SagB-type dehydrogenase family enzyme
MSRTSVDPPLRRASGVHIEWHDTDRLLIVGIISRRRAIVSEPVFRVLSCMRPKTMYTRTQVSALFPNKGADQLVESLVEAGVLLAAGSEAERYDGQLAASWRFGAAAAMLHFGSRPLVPPNWAARRAQLEALTTGPHVAMRRSPQRGAAYVPLPPVDEEDPLVRLLRQRRTRRPRPAGGGLSRDDLAALLFAGGGITGSVTDPLLGEHFLSTSPSVGGRNSFELHVIASDVNGLAEGVSVYDPVGGGLHPVTPILPNLRQLGGDQAWVADAQVVILLVAVFERLSSKYPVPSAYPALLIEAGHRAQNILLVCEARNLDACMTTAVDRDLYSQASDCDPVTHSPVYLVGVGKRDE